MKLPQSKFIVLEINHPAILDIIQNASSCEIEENILRIDDLSFEITENEFLGTGLVINEKGQNPFIVEQVFKCSPT